MYNYSINAVVMLLITTICMLILIYLCLPEVDLGKGQNCLTPCIPPTSKNLGIFVNLLLIPLLKAIFALAHKAICTLYLMVGSTHHTFNPIIYIPLVSPT